MQCVGGVRILIPRCVAQPVCGGGRGEGGKTHVDGRITKGPLRSQLLTPAALVTFTDILLYKHKHTWLDNKLRLEVNVLVNLLDTPAGRVGETLHLEQQDRRQRLECQLLGRRSLNRWGAA